MRRQAFIQPKKIFIALIVLLIFGTLVQAAEYSSFDQDQYDSLLKKGEDQVKDWNYKTALEYYTQAADMHPEGFQKQRLFAHIGILTEKNGKYSEAVKWFDRAIDADPNTNSEGNKVLIEHKCALLKSLGRDSEDASCNAF